jgi:hypothetical protein
MRNRAPRSFQALFIAFIVLAMAGLWMSSAQIWAEAEPPPNSPPIKLLIEPTKRIYSFREGLMVQFVLKATRRTKVCLEKDIMSQMQVRISRSGSLLPVEPLVLKDNRLIYHQSMQIRWLEPGEQLLFRANLKRFRFAGGESWEPGEYTVNATFNLCEQNGVDDYDPAGEEIPVEAEAPGWLMIMS